MFACAAAFRCDESEDLFRGTRLLFLHYKYFVVGIDGVNSAYSLDDDFAAFYSYGDYAVLAIPLTNSQPDINYLANVFRSYQYQNLSFGHNIQYALNVLRNQAFASSQVRSHTVRVRQQLNRHESISSFLRIKLNLLFGLRCLFVLLV